MTEKVDTGQISDGYHTFDELYEHRIMLFVALMNAYPDISWKSRVHDDGASIYPGWFIAGMDLPTGRITYHLRNTYWLFARVKELAHAKSWDGHDSEEVIRRLKRWVG